MNTINTNNQKIFTIEGNIGSGKSTFVKHLKEYYKDNNSIYFLDEPVEEWNEIKDKSNKNMIEKYYENQTRYAFAFQMMAYITRITKLQNALNDGYNIIITERCIYTDKNVFAKMLYDENKIEDVEYLIYNKWFEEFTANIPDIKVIYIKTKPEIAKERINFRNRKGEENIPLEYLQKCDIYHTNWVNNIKVKDKLILDGNTNINENPDYNNTLLKETDNFIWNMNNKNKNITGNIEEYILMFDGASRGNPGLSGCGFVIYDSKNTVIYKGSKFLNVQTNNYAEYMGLILGLEQAIKLGIQLINIQGDSVLIINQIKEIFACESNNLKPLKIKAQSLLNLFDSYKIDYISRSQNIYADKLANKGMDSCTDSLEYCML